MEQTKYVEFDQIKISAGNDSFFSQSKSLIKVSCKRIIYQSADSRACLLGMELYLGNNTSASSSGSVQNLVDSCVRVLVTAHKETILAECKEYIRCNETEKRVYQ